jgi:integrase
MRGHVRKRGDPGSWEYIVDIGIAAAERCTACNRRFWIERRPKGTCPKCGAATRETEERRRAIKGGFATQRECQTAMNKVLTAVEERTFVAPTKVSVKEFLVREWLPAIKGTIRASTYSSYKLHVERHIVPELGTLQLSRLTPSALNAFYGRLLEAGRCHGEGGLSPATVRRVHATLHRAGRDAVRWGRLSVNHADAADPPKGRSERRDLPAWSKEQLVAFLGHVGGDRLFCLWRIVAMTGCRRGEALGLRWEDVDMAAGTISICQTLVPVDGKVIISDPKTARGRRTIALDPVSLEALKTHASRQADEQSDWGEAWSDSGYVFVQQDGQPLDPHWVSKEFERKRREAALPRIPLHGLRHTYATLALSTGVNPRIVSGRLGHSTVALTLDIYSHVLPQQDQEAADRIAALLEV